MYVHRGVATGGMSHIWASGMTSEKRHYWKAIGRKAISQIMIITFHPGSARSCYFILKNTVFISGPARLGEIPPWARRDPGEVGWKFAIWTQLKARTFVRRELKWIDKENRISLEFENDWKHGHLLDGLQSTNGISGAWFRWGPAQHKELRKELAKLYEIRDVSLFEPCSVIIIPYITWSI